MDRQRLLAASLGIAFFLIPLYPAFITLTGAPVPGIALLPQRLTVALLVLAAIVATIWIAALARAPKRAMPTLLPVAAFPAAGLLAALLGFDPLASALFVGIAFGGVLWHATILRFARDPATLTTIFRAYVLSGALAALVAVAMVVSKTPSALYTIGHGRATGTFVLPGELAGYLILYVPVALALARALPSLRALALTGFAAGALAFVLTFSRAGFVGMAAAIAALVLLRRRERGARYAIAILGVAIVVTGLGFNAHHDPSENFTRLSIWDAALGMARDFPFSGVGPFEFPRIYQMLRDPGGEPLAFHAHSIVLTIAAETGIVGLAALLFGWWRFAVVLRARLRAELRFTVVAAAIAAGLIGTWVQGLIDTSSTVIFGLWLPFMALAIVCASDVPETSAPPSTPSAEARSTTVRASSAAVRVRGMTVRVRDVAVAVGVVFVAACAAMQVASSAMYWSAGAPVSLARHLGGLGARPYETIERSVPVPFVEVALSRDELARDAAPEAARYAARVPDGAVRSDLDGRIAEMRGRRAEAIRDYLDAADDEALHRIEAAMLARETPPGAASSARGANGEDDAAGVARDRREARDDARRIRAAYDLEHRVHDRLAAIATRPNAVADSSWRLGGLARRLGDDAEAARDYDDATTAAPLNTKYLFDAGALALRRHDPSAAAAYFTRITQTDPADADGVAGLGLAAVERGDRAEAARLSARANAINPHATLARSLDGVLAARRPRPIVVPAAKDAAPPRA